jgi:hypothetical protein
MYSFEIISDMAIRRIASRGLLLSGIWLMLVSPGFAISIVASTVLL